MAGNRNSSSDGGILGIVMAVITVLFWIRRRWSTDSKANSADKVESDFLVRLLARLKEADEALIFSNKERNLLAEEVGALRAEVKYLREARESDALRFKEQEARIRQLEKRLGFGPSDSTPLL